MPSAEVIAHLRAAAAETGAALATAGLSRAAVSRLAGLPPLVQDILADADGMLFAPGALTFETPVLDKGRPVHDCLLRLWDLERMVQEDAADREWVPDGLVPLGVGYEDGVVLLSLRPRDAGWVYYWDARWNSRGRRKYWRARIDRLPWTADENEARVVRLAPDLERWILSLGQQTV